MKHIMIMLSICFAMVIGYQQTTPAMESHTIQEVTVQEGDTLWDIAARSAGSSVDIREVVFEVKELNNISFTVKIDDLKEAVEISQELKEELGAEGVSYDANIAKISAIGIGLKTHYETTAEIFDTLAENGINIDMISCSEINVSCIIKEEDVNKAVRALHEKFIEEN